MKSQDLQELNDFIPYFNSFYGPQGLYPAGRNMTSRDIIKALCVMFENNPEAEFCGDSVDRERIAEIIFTTHKEMFAGE